MIRWLRNLFRPVRAADLSQHRLHTARYEDLCM